MEGVEDLGNRVTVLDCPTLWGQTLSDKGQTQSPFIFLSSAKSILPTRPINMTIMLVIYY